MSEPGPPPPPSVPPPPPQAWQRVDPSALGRRHEAAPTAPPPPPYPPGLFTPPGPYEYGPGPGPGGGWPPGPPGPPGPYGFPPPPPPPPRRTGTTRAVLIGVGAGLLVLAVLAGVLVATGNFSGTPTTAPSTHSAPATPTRPPSTSATVSGPTAHPTRTVTTAPTPTRPTPTHASPRPTRTTPQRNVLTQNTLYAYGRVGSVHCTMSSAGFGTVSEARRFWTAELGCLNATWSAVMKRTGHTFTAPHLTLFSATVQSPCGPYSAQTPFYCYVNKTIYMQVSYPMTLWRRGPQYNLDYDRAWQSFQLAHEYGHHVQNMTGIIEKAENQRLAVGENSSAGLAVSRRVELQAHCFAGAFLRANTGTYFTDPGVAFQFHYALGTPLSDTSHGTRTSQSYWMHRGYDHRTTTLCNTWAQSATHLG